MLDLLAYLEVNGFSNYIVSGGGRDFMRLSTPPTSTAARSPAGPRSTTFDDGPQKPIRIWSRVGRRPLLAAGNANGDVPMLDFTRHHDKPSPRLLVLHDDADREFDYTAGAEQVLERADADARTVISIKRDWSTVFPS